MVHKNDAAMLAIEVIDELLANFQYKEVKKLNKVFATQEALNEKTYFRQHLIGSMATIAFNEEEDPFSLQLMLETAIHASIKEFKIEDISNILLSQEDVGILIRLARSYSVQDNAEKSLKILYGLKQNLTKKYTDFGIYNDYCPFVIYNLTKTLGLMNKPKEALPLCDEGIKLCEENDEQVLLDAIIYNKALCLDDMGDKEGCLKILQILRDKDKLVASEEMENSIKKEVQRRNLNLET